MELRTIEIFQDENGSKPYHTWLNSLKDKKTISRIAARLDRVAGGNLGDYKSVDKGVFELRFHFGAGYRVYFGEVDNVLILLLCGGDKSSQAKDVKKAQGLWKRYLEMNP